MKLLITVATLGLFLLAGPAPAQQAPGQRAAATAAVPAPGLDCQVLTGRVTDPFAYPLTGATIMLRAPGKGFSLDAYSTNAEGKYIISCKQAIPLNTVLEVSASGYSTLEVALANCRPLDLTLTPLNAPQYKVKTKFKKGGSRMR